MRKYFDITKHKQVKCVTVLLATHFGKKQGDFGMFTSCVLKDGMLRIDCWYPPCYDETPFQCEFTNSNGELLGSSTKSVFRNDSVFIRSGRVCHLFLNNHRNADKAVNFTCQLTRRKRLEKKILTVGYDKGKGEHQMST